MKRNICLSLFLIVVLSLTGFAKPLELWVVGWSNEMARIAEDLIATEYTPKTGVEVNITPIGWGDGDKITLAIISNDAPDIVTGGVELGIRGAVIDLRKTFGNEFEELEASLFPAITKQTHFEGTRFAIPQNISVMNAAYRTDILADMGMEIPVTWDDVRQMRPKLNANGSEMAFFYGSPDYDALWGAYTLITQHGGNFFKTDGFTSAMDQPESIRGFTEYVELYTKHNMPQSVTGITQFRNGELTMMIDGYWIYTNLLQSAPEIAGKWEPGLIPGTKRPDGTINHGTFTGGSHWAIPTTTKDKEQAWNFMKWFLSDDIQRRYTDAVITGIPGFLMVPTSMEALYTLEGLPENIVKVIHAQIDQSIAVPYAPTQGVHYRFINFAIQSCLQLNSDPETEAIKSAVEMNKEMDRRKIEYKRFLDQLHK
ncbi:MAG: extracellular solute-binding protein [Firmicutes bacterium]|nr:extracellular solute-binding protein [Bacillota bacterium]MDD4263628.1 extracellular solute-binding protein [Bacillota bacterium]MDD4692994.1 extracellular solute-binding protein [Bacillota bacterium]